MREAVEAKVGEKDRARIHFISPEECFIFLDAPEPGAEETTVGGYKMKVRYRPARRATRKCKAVLEIPLKSLKPMKG